LEKWFAERRKSKVLDIAYRQMTLAIDTVTELERAMVAASNGAAADAKKSIERLFVVETEIDDLRRTVFEELTRGSLPPKDREDIMHLVKRLDVMADHVKDSGRSLLLLAETQMPRDVWDELVAMTKDLVEESRALRASIEKLGENAAEVRALTLKVDEAETRIDEHYLKTKELILKHGREMDAATMLVLRDLLQSLEEVADSCDDTADYVRILTVTRETA
jgi:predicted phosphate transport protein (TIGR00153 family)